MSNETKKPTDNRTAAQRLADLETAVAQLYSATDLMARDLTILKNTAKLLNNKVSAIVEATAGGEALTDAVLDRIMIDNNVKDLANKVTNMVLNGIVAQEDQVSENSFIVGSESDDDGKLVNPRIQFALKALTPDLQSKLIGAKPGDSIKFQEGKMAFKLLESYKIQDAPAPEAASAADAAPEAAPAEQAAEQDTAPAAEAPTTTN